LKQVGSSNWEATGLSGPATYGQPNQGAFGSLLSGAIERSNVDIAEELGGLVTAQRNFQAKAKAIDTATQVSQTIMNPRTRSRPGPAVKRQGPADQRRHDGQSGGRGAPP